ncbi:hypothetical protein ABH922_003042 [Rhodococcus sp. 27YEA15]|uniref:hypothetical protein n=1 Tax=Rhodococcus sp. 27YEA15 TaxID=3156259 RepID=UPI003C7DDDE1
MIPKPLPGMGDWEQIGQREFARAERDGLPTIEIVQRSSEIFLVTYWVSHYKNGERR